MRGRTDFNVLTQGSVFDCLDKNSNQEVAFRHVRVCFRETVYLKEIAVYLLFLFAGWRDVAVYVVEWLTLAVLFFALRTPGGRLLDRVEVA